MSTTVPPSRQPAVDKHDVRRRALAESALQTLADRGYAHTSLRDIAANSEFSHGVVHYYFRDKTELISYCVRYYKAQCVTRYDDLVAAGGTPTQFATAFADKLCETLIGEAGMHRLWYDLRTQSMFTAMVPESLRDDVMLIDAMLEQMIWRVMQRYAELSGATLAVSSGEAYGLLDGLFEQALLAHLAERPTATELLSCRVGRLLPTFLVDSMSI